MFFLIFNWFHAVWHFWHRCPVSIFLCFIFKKIIWFYSGKQKIWLIWNVSSSRGLIPIRNQFFVIVQLSILFEFTKRICRYYQETSIWHSRSLKKVHKNRDVTICTTRITPQLVPLFYLSPAVVFASNANDCVSSSYLLPLNDSICVGVCIHSFESFYPNSCFYSSILLISLSRIRLTLSNFFSIQWVFFFFFCFFYGVIPTSTSSRVSFVPNFPFFPADNRVHILPFPIVSSISFAWLIGRCCSPSVSKFSCRTILVFCHSIHRRGVKFTLYIFGKVERADFSQNKTVNILTICHYRDNKFDR